MAYRNGVVFWILSLSCFWLLRISVSKLPQGEVDALQQIATSMGAIYWEFNSDSCQVEVVGLTAQAPWGSESSVNCPCNFVNDTYCHVDKIVLKGYSLPGMLPPELVKLPYLQEISVLVNRLSGEIPKELGNFSSLTYLNLEANQFSGSVPSELGKLVNLNTLILSSNQLSGELPTSLAGLRNLTDFRINDNNFSGAIPNFIQNWKQLGRLEMYASGFQGPIPPNISLLNKLTHLRISDINGTAQRFPNFNNTTGLITLVLRSCNIYGEIPGYVWEIYSLQMLDLSFNSLVGDIPNNIPSKSLKFVFLSDNMLSGNIPDSILTDGSSIKSILPCMKDVTCPRYGCSLHVNCGGNDLTTREGNEKVVYEGDASVEGGSSKYYRSNSYWGFSSTGEFMDDIGFQNVRFVKAVSSTNISELYTTARLAPSSLTYFRYCLENGNYIVNLQFAEIFFTNDNTYNSLGRRLFDIYIQACHLPQGENFTDLLDPKLGSEVNKEEVERMVKVALLCTNASPSLRPTMSEVLCKIPAEITGNNIPSGIFRNRRYSPVSAGIETGTKSVVQVTGFCLKWTPPSLPGVSAVSPFPPADNSLQGCFWLLRISVSKLPQGEVDALQQIATSMGAIYWEFNSDSCQVEVVGLTAQAPWGSVSSVKCQCNFVNDTYCHVDKIVLKGYSLPGMLPPELVKLPYLQEISVLVNRLSGEIPKELGNFSSLTYLNLEANQFSGSVPSELGKLVNLNTLILSSNQLSGELPTSLAGLRNLTDFRINDNNFSGAIPNFIQNWKQLGRLEMYASGFQGPIPPNISLLNKLTDLRISDINGTAQRFPNFNNTTGLITLVLRSCNIYGEIPGYVWKIYSLQMLDLGFNSLVGDIPNNIPSKSLKFVFLSGNMLSGNIPDSILTDGSSIKSILPCMKDVTCPRYGCSLHVNCGGNDLTTREGNEKAVYEGDASVEGGSSKYYRSNSYWGFSSTGDFMDDDAFQNVRFVKAVSSTNISGLYTTARLAPISLTYFRYCLENGNYIVNLQFAEIFFTNDNTYNSLGRRIFDIYIQACHLPQGENFTDLVDPKLGSEVNKEEVERMVKVALLCTNASPSLRPTMSEAVSMLEGRMTIPSIIPDPNSYIEDLRFKAMRDFHEETQKHSSSRSQTQNSSALGTDIASSSTSH
ncbi:hypothetical protein RHGRI_004405 [Rhododendron griersonianum]|uniref:non-specific serine/threonine protein kinase n=1 Tax=Rhododendron griersonianum TaxID=479676 RepID=A0AAV6L9A7_9ERIC|nr:hypothetical protein RHGRI_004405 [Rhododendron griersonianum]